MATKKVNADQPKMTRRVHKMQTAYLKELTAHRDRQRPGADVCLDIASAAFDRKMEDAREGRGDVIEFYEPLAHLDDTTYSLVITILDEKIKAIFAYDPELQQKVDQVQLKKFEEARLRERLKSYENLNDVLRGELREKGYAMATMRREHGEEVRELRAEIDRMKVEAEERGMAASSEAALLAETKEELADQIRMAGQLARQLGAAKDQVQKLTNKLVRKSTRRAAAEGSSDDSCDAADAESEGGAAAEPTAQRPREADRSQKSEELGQMEDTGHEEAMKQKDREIGMLETQIAILKLEVARAQKAARRSEASVPLSDSAILTLEEPVLDSIRETECAAPEDYVVCKVGRVPDCNEAPPEVQVEEAGVQTDLTLIEEFDSEEPQDHEEDSPGVSPGAVEAQATAATVGDNTEATRQLMQLREEAEEAEKRAKALATSAAALQDHKLALEAELASVRVHGDKETAARLAKEKELATTKSEMDKLEKQQQKVVLEREEARSRVRVLQNKVANQLISAPVHGNKAQARGPSVHAVAALAAQHQQQLELVETRRLKTEAAYRTALAQIADLTAQLERAQEDRGQEAWASPQVSPVRSSPKRARLAEAPQDAGAAGSKPSPSAQTADGPPALQRRSSNEPPGSGRRQVRRANTIAGKVHEGESVLHVCAIGANLPDSVLEVPTPRPASVRTVTVNSRKDRAKKAAAAAQKFASLGGSGLDNPAGGSVLNLGSGAMASAAVSAATGSLQAFPSNLGSGSVRPIVAAKGSLKALPPTSSGNQPGPIAHAKAGSRNPSMGPSAATPDTPKVRGPHAGAPPPIRTSNLRGGSRPLAAGADGSEAASPRQPQTVDRIPASPSSTAQTQAPRPRELVIGKARPRLSSQAKEPEGKTPDGKTMEGSPRRASIGSVPDGGGSPRDPTGRAWSPRTGGARDVNPARRPKRTATGSSQVLAPVPN